MKTPARVALLTGLSAAVLGGSFIVVKARLATSDPEEAPEPAVKIVKPDSRPVPTPAGTLTVSLTRSDLPQLPVVEVNDQHDFLFLANADEGEYELHSKGKKKTVKAIDPVVECHLMANGVIAQTAHDSPATGSLPSIYPFNEVTPQMKFTNHGWSLYVRKNIMVGSNERGRLGSPVVGKGHERFKSDYYVLAKEQRKAAKSTAPVKQNAAVLSLDGSAAPDNVPSSPPSAAGGGAMPQPFSNVAINTKELYASEKSLAVLAVDDQDNVWVAEHEGFISAGKDRLLRFSDQKVEAIPMPNGYANVHRVSSTKGVLAATFGILNGKLPFRSFVRKGNNWQELPLPTGFDCSFVQQVFLDGSMLGYVTSWDGKLMKHVVWKGDAIAVLDDLPAWPKRGALSVIWRSNRVGDICVRNFLDLVTGASDYYVLSIRS